MSAPVQLPMAPPAAAGPVPVVRDAGWHRAARITVLLSWVSLAYMGVEGGVGIWQGAAAGSIALVGWGLASFIEGMASAVIVWRFTGSRKVSDDAEHRAQRLVAAQFFLLAPYVLVESVRTLIEGGHADVTIIGMVLTATSAISMPLLGRAKHRLAERLSSTATAGEGTQNVLCGIQAAAVLIGLGANAAVGAWWLDPMIGLFIAFVAIEEGRKAWHGDSCCTTSPLQLICDEPRACSCEPGCSCC